MSYTQRGDRPRVMTPVDLVVATAKAKTALWAYIGIARYADNRTGQASCTVGQVADVVGIGRSQASVGIGWLIAHGWVTRLVEGRKGAGSSLYEVHMEPQATSQHPESRTLTSASEEPDADDGPASGNPGAETQSASGFPDADTPSATGNPDAGPESASGNPDHSVRKVGRSLVSSLVSKNKDTPLTPHGGNEPTTTAQLPGLLVEASTPPASKRKRRAADHTYPADFAAFWEAAPRRRGKDRGSKPEALREWRAALARGLTNDTLIAAAKAYSRAADPTYIPDTCRWLKGELYEPYVGEAQGVAPGEPTDAELDAVLGKALITLPAPPPGVHPGTAEYAAWKAQFFAALRAERVRQYRQRVNTRSIA
jgi:hypothetical protein